MKEQIITFLDTIQRTIIATLVSEEGGKLTVTKPVILNVTPTQEKKLQVQLYPLVFREFLNDRDKHPKWVYNTSGITIAEGLELEPNLLKQYEQMFSSTKGETAPTVQLFDPKNPGSE